MKMELYEKWFSSFTKLMTNKNGTYNFGMTNLLFSLSVFLNVMGVLNYIIWLLNVPVNPLIGFAVIFVGFIIFIFINKKIFEKKVTKTINNSKIIPLIILLIGYAIFISSLIISNM